MGMWHDFITNTNRPIHKWVHYFPIYERHFHRFRNQTLTFFEIGCGRGGSLQMWKRFLGPFAQIVGIDIDADCKAFEEDQITIQIGRQEDEDFLKQLILEFGPPDIVVDDGSHQMKHITASFNFIYPRMQKNSIYLVEDLHTAYWDEYGGGLDREGSFIEFAKQLVDQLNADHSRNLLIPNEFTRETLSIHFYDSVTVFEKGRHIHKHAPIIPDS